VARLGRLEAGKARRRGGRQHTWVSVGRGEETPMQRWPENPTALGDQVPLGSERDGAQDDSQGLLLNPGSKRCSW
jgi:hypothetical protein